MSRFGAAATVVALAAACGGTGGGVDYGGGGGSDSGEAGTVTVTSPKDGATVRSPVTLKFDAGDIGPTDTGKDHVHLFVDGNENDYTVVTKNSFVIKGLADGKHTITVTKQHADHSPTGAEAEIEVNVTGGGSSDDSSESSDDNGGGGYGY